MLRDYKSILERFRPPKKKTEIEPGMSPEEIADIVSDKLMVIVRGSFAETKEKLEKRNNMENTSLAGTSTCMTFSTTDSVLVGGTGTYSLVIDPDVNWSKPTLVDTQVFSDRIELIYVRHSLVFLSWQGDTRQVYKIVYSCVDGKWNESEKIFGQIIPAQEETYSFDGQPA